MFHPPDEVSPRRRLRAWLQEQLAADPGLDAEELTKRALDHFADDQELLDLAFSQAVGREVAERMVESGYRPTADNPGLREKSPATEP